MKSFILGASENYGDVHPQARKHSPWAFPVVIHKGACEFLILNITTKYMVTDEKSIPYMVFSPMDNRNGFPYNNLCNYECRPFRFCTFYTDSGK